MSGQSVLGGLSIARGSTSDRIAATGTAVLKVWTNVLILIGTQTSIGIGRHMSTVPQWMTGTRGLHVDSRLFMLGPDI
jgi:hypothetical protein